MQQQPIQDSQLYLSLQQIRQYDSQLLANKKEMIQLMKAAPATGVYRGDDPKIFYQQFFPFYINFLKAEIGPRGWCSRSVRLSMSQNPQFYNQLLKPLQMFHDSHIRDIYVKYKLYTPCKQYEEIVKLKQSIIKTEDAYEKICDEESIMYQKIKSGMIDKRGEQYDYKTQIGNLQQNYETKIKALKERQSELQSYLDQHQGYLHYMRIKKQMKKYFEMWKQADTRIGLQSVSKGSDFETKVRRQIMPIILKRANIQYVKGQVEILVNCRWNPKNLGQIDIAVAERDLKSQKWIVTVLIECKSKLFDIRQAYKQVGVLKSDNFVKESLSTKLGILPISQKYQYFIITTLPQNPFNLPIESKLKQAMEKGSKNKAISEIDSKEVYLNVKQKFDKELSPLNWLQNHDSDRIIVLKPKSTDVPEK